MANNATNYLELEVLDHVLGEGARNYTPGTLTVGLFTAVTDQEAGTVTEVTGGSYARTAVDFGVASAGAASNSANVTFPTATADWGTVTHAGIHDGVDWIFIGALTVSKTVTNGDTFQISTGQLTVSLD